MSLNSFQSENLDFQNSKVKKVLQGVNSIYYDFVLNKENTRKPIVLIFGGRGSGKSRAVAQRILFQMLQMKIRVVLMRKVMDSVRDSSLREILDLITENGISIFFETKKSPLQINCINGSEIIVKGLDKSSKVKSLSNVDIVWIEEADELSLSDWLDVLPTIRGKMLNGQPRQIILTFNAQGDHWIRRYFFNTDLSLKEPERVYALQTNWTHNHFLDADFSIKLESLKELNPSLYKRYALGEFADVEGRVFSKEQIVTLEDVLIDIQFANGNFKCLGYGVDFGFNSPSTLVQCAVSLNIAKRPVIVLKELIYVSKITQEHFARRCAEAIPVHRRRLPVICDSASPSGIECLRSVGLNAFGVEKNTARTGFRRETVLELIEWMFVISKSSTNLLREFAEYSWTLTPNGYIDEPVDYNDHAIDAVRYWYWHYRHSLRAILENRGLNENERTKFHDTNRTWIQSANPLS